jgi:hypothetical protein
MDRTSTPRCPLELKFREKMPTGRSRKRWLRKVLEGKKELERC